MGNNVKLDYDGKNGSLMRDISIADARWIGGLLSRLSDRQIQTRFAPRTTHRNKCKCSQVQFVKELIS